MNIEQLNAKRESLLATARELASGEGDLAQVKSIMAEAKKKGKTPNYNEIYPKLVIRADGKVTYKKVDKIINSFREIKYTDLNFETIPELSGKTKK